MSKETGGNAFPIPGADFHTFMPNNAEEYKRIQSGMTLRDYFAGLAMQGICAHSETWGMAVPQIASQAYKMADAMLKARSE
jgi:hypothetical protein